MYMETKLLTNSLKSIFMLCYILSIFVFLLDPDSY